MKSVLLGSIAALVIAYASYVVLDKNFQQTADERFQTPAVRL